jgi:oligopeptide transport system substrate-binding protein
VGDVSRKTPLAAGYFISLLFVLTACNKTPWNDPYPSSEATGNIRYTSFAESPRTLDPAKAFTADEAVFVAQIYEPPLQYHYLKRPYTLVPLTASQMPTIEYYDAKGQQLSEKVALAAVDKVAYSIYNIKIKPGIYYQPHPAFAKDVTDHYYYHNLGTENLKHIKQLSDFKHVGTRELTADDYVYEIKRLAQPQVNSPIFGLMSSHIWGLSAYSKQLATAAAKNPGYLDLRAFPFEGAQAINRYEYRIVIKGIYPQFLYWLAMAFFAPVPWEVDLFYSQPGMRDTNITFDWYPVGTGPYQLVENNPNRRMVLQRNPNFHLEHYPEVGEPGDKAAGYLRDAGKPLPFIDKIVFSLEKEYMPRWNKFLQGYYDLSALSPDSFSQAIQIDEQGKPYLTPKLKALGVRLQTSVTPSITYIGFNMLDDVVGGYSESARKLRLAIAIAINYEEYILIFLNGRGVVAQGPIPPGIFGYVSGSAGIDPYVYEWQNNAPKRKSIAVAKQLLAEAGYANGIDPKTGERLILNYDLPMTSGPEEKDYLSWLRKQFMKLGIQLNIRGTDFNRFQEKMRTGHAQIFSWGWIADYPDPEDFLFTLYGPNGKVQFGGENAANYNNQEFNALFDKMKTMPNSPERQKIINRMVKIAQRDSPWVWGEHPKDFVLSHQWNYPSKPNVMASNTLKYLSLDPMLRAKLRNEWNKTVLWPLAFFVGIFVLIILPVFIRYRRKEYWETVKSRRSYQTKDQNSTKP